MLQELSDFCRLVLLRHPDLDQAHANVAVGAGPAALSRRGKERVLQWMDLLQNVVIHHVVSSDQPQCSKPAAGLARAHDLEVVEEARLRDQDMGKWQGRRWDDLVADDQAGVTDFFERFTDSVPPDGESLGQAVERMLEWWTQFGRDKAGESVAIVAPGSMLSGFAAAMLGLRLSRCLSLTLPHGGLGVLDVYANGVRMSCWNADGLA